MTNNQLLKKLLAGITISSLTESGLFEKVKLAVLASYDETGNLNDEYLKENINRIEGLEEEIEEVVYDLVVKVNRYEFIISSLEDVKLKGTTVAEQSNAISNLRNELNGYANIVNDMAAKNSNVEKAI